MAKVAVSKAIYAIDKPYDYLVPPELEGQVLPGMRVAVPFGSGNRGSDGIVPVSYTHLLSFRVSGMDCEELGEALGRRDIALRSGLHCAPLAHRTAGTLETGTVRASVSAFNVPQEIPRFVRELRQILSEKL